jgi:protein-L-isoaspartate(D-aspartate) O-methyltransferase
MRRASLLPVLVLASGCPGQEARFAEARAAMVRDQLAARGIRDTRVLAAMEAVPRHRFVPEAHRPQAYGDHPLPIGQGQTISQPFIVAFMAEALRLQPSDRVLEVGSGSGYALAVLARLAAEVRGIELEPELCARSRETLAALGLGAVAVRCGDGFGGWPEAAPFDAILVSCAAPSLPEPLLRQLKVGGRLVAPVGEGSQELVCVTRTATGMEERRLLPVRFVPMRRKPGAQP